MQDQEQALAAEVAMAEVIREARVRARLSMRGLARRSGLSAAQISRIEAGEVEWPAAETLVKLAKALDRDASSFLSSPTYQRSQGTAASAAGDRGAARAGQS